MVSATAGAVGGDDLHPGRTHERWPGQCGISVGPRVRTAGSQRDRVLFDVHQCSRTGPAEHRRFYPQIFREGWKTAGRGGAEALFVPGRIFPEQRGQETGRGLRHGPAKTAQHSILSAGHGHPDVAEGLAGRTWIDRRCGLEHCISRVRGYDRTADALVYPQGRGNRVRPGAGSRQRASGCRPDIAAADHGGETAGRTESGIFPEQQPLCQCRGERRRSLPSGHSRKRGQCLKEDENGRL